MLKIAVFDSGWGGELVADAIEEELSVVEVIRVIDWRNAPYADKPLAEVRGCTEVALEPYIGRVEVIVLASYEASLALDYLRERYPEQKFVGFRLNLNKLVKYPAEIGKVLVLSNPRVYQACREELARTETPDGLRAEAVIGDTERGDWMGLIDEGEMTRAILKRTLTEHLDPEVSTVVLANTHFWDVKGELERLLGWRARVVDERRQFLHGLCLALGLRGVDGWRAK